MWGAPFSPHPRPPPPPVAPVKTGGAGNQSGGGWGGLQGGVGAPARRPPPAPRALDGTRRRPRRRGRVGRGGDCRHGATWGRPKPGRWGGDPRPHGRTPIGGGGGGGHPLRRGRPVDGRRVGAGVPRARRPSHPQGASVGGGASQCGGAWCQQRRGFWGGRRGAEGHGRRVIHLGFSLAYGGNASKHACCSVGSATAHQLQSSHPLRHGMIVSEMHLAHNPPVCTGEATASPIALGTATQAMTEGDKQKHTQMMKRRKMDDSDVPADAPLPTIYLRRERPCVGGSACPSWTTPSPRPRSPLPGRPTHPAAPATSPRGTGATCTR